MTNQQRPDRPIRVGLIFGGASSEHGVSCLGAAGVVRAIDTDRYQVTGIGVATDGRWTRVAPADIERLRIVDGRLPELDGTGPEVALVPTANGPVLAMTDGSGSEPLDVAMIIMHGPGGEDGTVQGVCETAGLRYTGSGVAASAVCMDKHLMKLMLKAAGVPVGPFVVITPEEWTTDRAAALDAVGALTLPVFVKPARAGSSRGISRVATAGELPAAIEEARRHDPKVIIEEGFVDARELECGVLQGPDGPPRVSVVGEVIMHGKDGFYDYESKYTPGDEVSIQVPAEVPDDVTERLQQQALRVFELLGCEGLARVDSFLTREGRVMINEINTLPGFTPTSMFPKVFEAGDIDFAEQIDTLVSQALGRPAGLR
ncbi:D-alanine--D-alanine ligase family protein [Naumannella huperziae]